MKNEFVPYEQALALKELGFNEPCFGNWQDMKEENPWFSKSYTDSQNQYYGQLCSAPLYQQAFRWFREEYCLSSYIRPNIIINTPKLHQFIIEDTIDDFWFETYEEAELECLKKLIEIVKQK